MAQHQMQVGPSQCYARDGFGHMSNLSRNRLQKLAPDRCAEEQVADLNSRSRTTVPSSAFRYLPAVARDFRANFSAKRARLKLDTCDASNRCQGFTPESHRADAKEVFGVKEFACRVILKYECKIFRFNAATIVDNPDQLSSTFFQIDLNASVDGIDVVLSNFCHSTGWTLDILAVSDFGDDDCW